MSSARMCVGVFRIILDFFSCVWGYCWLVSIGIDSFFVVVCHEEYIVTTFCCVLGCLLFNLNLIFKGECCVFVVSVCMCVCCVCVFWILYLFYSCYNEFFFLFPLFIGINSNSLLFL